jgi:hypothetical protein
VQMSSRTSCCSRVVQGRTTILPPRRRGNFAPRLVKRSALGRAHLPDRRTRSKAS